MGYGRATTNHIAAEAEVSPATLYHFFDNKEAIAEALAARYTASLIETQNRISLDSLAAQPLAGMIDGIVDAFLDFHQRHPAVKTLFVDTAVSPETLERKNTLDTAFRVRMADLFLARCPAIGREGADWTAQVASCIFQGMLRLINASSGERRSRAIGELKELLAGYLGRVLV